MNENAIISIKQLGFQWETQDPFLFCVYHHDHFPPGNERLGPAASLAGRSIGQDFIPRDGWRMYHGQKVPGFPAHPHRGFETVTIVRKGLADHADSMGGTGRFGLGDVQWMTAGKGVLHSEMFPLLDPEKGNELELFQIWLNLPKAKKFAEPHYKMFWANDIPGYQHNDENGKKVHAKIIAGSIGEVKAIAPPPESWAADPSNELQIWTIRLEAGATWKLPLASETTNRSIYLYEGGRIKINGTEMRNSHAANLRPEITTTIENGDQDAFLLLLQGKPLNENVVQYGPFVMNSQEEIQQAFADYRNSQFGGWPWLLDEPVHPRGQKRFAKYPDGHEEYPE